MSRVAETLGTLVLNDAQHVLNRYEKKIRQSPYIEEKEELQAALDREWAGIMTRATRYGVATQVAALRS